MGWLINERKLKAASASMHQFCQVVREIFPGNVDDRIVEAATLHLYSSLARDLFGQRFAAKLHKKLHGNLKYSTAAEVEGRIARIEKHAETLEKAAADKVDNKSAEEVVRMHVASTIDAMLSDAGFQQCEPDEAKKVYERFERAIMDIRKHLLGIRDANSFVMKTKQAV